MVKAEHQKASEHVSGAAQLESQKAKAETVSLTVNWEECPATKFGVRERGWDHGSILSIFKDSRSSEKSL